MNDVLIEIKNLKTHFFTEQGVVKAVNGVSLQVQRGKTLCVVGESGCGKSVTARSILQLVDKPGEIVEGEIRYYRGSDDSIDLAAMNPRGKAIRAIRGREIAMIFQEPMTSLSPVHKIGEQIEEVMLLHLNVNKEEARERAIEVLQRVGIPKPASRLDNYPFELSGGMRQRAMIAMALSCEPVLLIADEPTTALDVTTQANILDLMYQLQSQMNMAMIFITHDLGVVAEIADDVAVMYLGRVVEQGPVDDIFHNPKHPYTKALLESIPRLEMNGSARLASIRGMVPHPFDRPTGCTFHPRCDQFIPGVCDRLEPEMVRFDDSQAVNCLLYQDVAKTAVSPTPASTSQ